MAAQWDSSKNAPLTPDQVTARSKKEVWWRCKHGHTWPSAINKRVRGDGCPYYTDHSNKLGSVAEERPALLEEWDYTLHKACKDLLQCVNQSGGNGQ
ncbi:zinc-ribbon domain-containing protein [Intestinimonas sp. HCP28S3_D6]|uniref:zinc-ribbon domain-containing protein n=1 Tax=Intestinimonas sp. HCP28S3_D6 TaxID=3438942 RepID=UPI003F8BF1CD